MNHAMDTGSCVAKVQSFDAWRSTVRMLLAQRIPPHAVQWTDASESADLFSVQTSQEAPGALDKSDVASASQRECSPLHIPREMMEMLRTAACFRSTDRWAFLYRVVWRWDAGERETLSAADEDGRRLHAMIKAVRREVHDMHAYVRFRESANDAGPRFVAWHEPAHDVLPQVAQHFARRMGKTTWMIATPDASVLWDGVELHYAGPLMQGPANIDDGGESLWLTYYRSIFNPARLNTRVMQNHVRARFWKNLPEGAVVPEMVANASAGARRVGQAQQVAQRHGAVIPIAPARAQPQRPVPTTLDQCRRCELWRHATQAVRGVGPDDAQIMLVGEQPGDQEDIAGAPFIGPAGQLLDQVLEQSGVTRRALYLTNAVKHFKWEPRGKRRLHKTPGQLEIMACRHWLQEEIARIRPKVVVALGSTALKSLLGTQSVNLGAALGKPFQHEGYWIIAVYHPAYALRVPEEQARTSAVQVMVEGLRLAKNLLAQREPLT